MAHLHPAPRSAPHRSTITRPHESHVHYIAMLLLAAVVLIVTLGVRDHRPPPVQTPEANTPSMAPRFK